ncbi:hypothetical protein NPIL_642741 [Nephila pilipes]|uniref:Uncharacterized protein n=1 Tax=Nephila pilipes TaxID=299642 RepID=A0A8X6NWY5_NEPPI|nr:hypothetical protein NPIL_642741 [Nephila pilipes]
MHHHPRNQERAINLSILAVSGPGSTSYPLFLTSRGRASLLSHRPEFLRRYRHPPSVRVSILPSEAEPLSHRPEFFTEVPPPSLGLCFILRTGRINYWPSTYDRAERPPRGTARSWSRGGGLRHTPTGQTPQVRRSRRVRQRPEDRGGARNCKDRLERPPANGDSDADESAPSTTGFLHGACARRPDARGASPRTGTRRGTSPHARRPGSFTARAHADPMPEERAPERGLDAERAALAWEVFGPVFGPGEPPVPFHAPGHSAEVPGPAVFGRARPSFIRSGRTPRAAGGPRPLPPTLQCFGSSARTPIRPRALGKNPRLLLSQSFLPPVPRDPAGRRIAPASPAHSLVLRIVRYKHRSGRGRWATPATPSEPILPSSGPYGPRGPPDQTGLSRSLSSASDRQLEQPIRPRALGNTRDSSFVVPSTLRSPRTPRAAGSPRQLRPSPDGATSPSVRSPDAPSLYESAGEPPPPASRLARPAAAPPPLDRGAPEAREQPGGTSHRI